MTLLYYYKPIYPARAEWQPIPAPPKKKKRKTYVVEEERIGAVAVEYTDTLATDLLAEIRAKARAEAREQARAIQALINEKSLELRQAREEAARQQVIAPRQAEAFAIWQDRQFKTVQARTARAIKTKDRIINRANRNMQIMADLHDIIEIAERYL